MAKTRNKTRKTKSHKRSGANVHRSITARAGKTRLGKSRPAGPASRTSAEDKLAGLKRRLFEIRHLSAANSVLSRGLATYMPNGGAASRGRLVATMHRLA